MHLKKNHFIILILVLVLLPLAGEAVASLFLPPSTPHRLPLLKQIADPIVGYRLAPNQTGFSLNAPVTTNKWGYRGPDWTIEKPKNTVRIAVLGASLTFGHGVEEKYMFTTQLQNILNENPPVPGIRYEVLNFGVGGYDIGHSINVLKQDVLKFHPDMILLSSFMGDVFYVKDYSFYPEFFRLQEKNFSMLRWNVINFCRQSRLAMWLWDQIKNHLWGREPDQVEEMIQRYAIDGLSPLEGPNADGWKFIVDRLNEYSKITKSAGIPSVFMVLPTHQEILDIHAKSTYAKFYAEVCQSFGIHYIWLIQNVRREQALVQSFLIPYDFHLKKEGHEWMAKKLAQELTPVLMQIRPKN